MKITVTRRIDLNGKAYEHNASAEIPDPMPRAGALCALRVTGFVPIENAVNELSAALLKSLIDRTVPTEINVVPQIPNPSQP